MISRILSRRNAPILSFTKHVKDRANINTTNGPKFHHPLCFYSNSPNTSPPSTSPSPNSTNTSPPSTSPSPNSTIYSLLKKNNFNFKTTAQEITYSNVHAAAQKLAVWCGLITFSYNMLKTTEKRILTYLESILIAISALKSTLLYFLQHLPSEIGNELAVKFLKLQVAIEDGWITVKVILDEILQELHLVSINVYHVMHSVKTLVDLIPKIKEDFDEIKHDLKELRFLLVI